MIPTAENTAAPAAPELLNGLLECELSAVATYERFFEKMSGRPGIQTLYRAQEQHLGSAMLLRARIRELGGRPVTTPGVWGVWPVAVEETSRVVGEVAELDALKQEEEHSLARYRQALSLALDDKTRELLRNVLLPRLESHFAALSALLAKLEV